MTDATGAKTVTTIEPIRQVIADDANASIQRYLVIVPVRNGVPEMPVQVQL